MKHDINKVLLTFLIISATINVAQFTDFSSGGIHQY